MGWPFYHSDFKSVSVSLDINKKEIISFKKLKSNEKICRPSLLTYYAHRFSNDSSKFDTQTYIPISILNPSVNKMEPTFINPIIKLNMCICLQQIRALKYMMKSCFIVETLLEEANECKRLFTNKKLCNICKNQFSFCE